MASVQLRNAVPGDAPALGAVHVVSWCETYTGLLPDAMLAALSVEARTAMWAHALGDPAAAGGIAVAEAEGGIVGFGACGAQRDAALAAAGFGGEIGALYVLRSHQRANIGRALLRMMARVLLDQAHTGVALWVLADNRPARAFYERLGGAVVGEKQEKLAETMLIELAYGWPDLAPLTR